MKIEQKKYTPREYIRIGMAFLLLGFCISTAGEAVIQTAFAKVFHSPLSAGLIQGATAGLSIPFLAVSIYFNVRGLAGLRSG